jgi:hypothetical protein
VSDDVTLQGSLVVEVELLEGLAGREPGGSDAELAAVGLPGCDFAFEARGEELILGPAVCSGSLADTFDG